jgi:hypothetical protein
MVKPVGPQVGPSDGSSTWGMGSTDSIPPGPMLPPDDPWVKNLAILFPNAPLAEIQAYAAQFQKNMFAALNNQISHDLKQAREAAKKFKESIEDNG